MTNHIALMEIALPPHPIVEEIRRFCAQHNMPLSVFGLAVMNDKSWAYAVCNRGREPKRASVERAREFMRTYEDQPK